MKFLTIPIFIVLLGCASQTNESLDKSPLEYVEKHRPQYHFTPPSQWMNDPNGMVYFEGEYHLFYQYYPDSNVWGPMHWGHAVSEDMIKWDHMPIALYPDSLGYIFSGSAVVDWNNTSGFGINGNPPLIAIYTYHDMEGEQSGRTDYQYQGIAYSLDNGRTWTKYEQNPVLPNQGIKDFRDPKVIWIENHQKWIMTLAEWDHVSFYSSSDLKSWKKESDFGLAYGVHAGVWECPDLFPLVVEGTDELKWVLLVSINPGGPQGGSATQYFIGDFDGSEFVLDATFEEEVRKLEEEERAVWLDYGADNYAGVTWSDIPDEDGRRLFIGWMSNWQYAQIVPTTKWRSAMTLPRSLKLVNTSVGYRLHSPPVKEIDAYINPTLERGDSTFVIEGQMEGDFAINISNNLNEAVIVGTRDNQLFVDRTNSGQIDFHKGFGAIHSVDVNGITPKKVQVFVDASSIEVFINNGELVMTELVFPKSPYTRVESEGVIDVSTQSVASIWN